jgi:hypothetical protein
MRVIEPLGNQSAKVSNLCWKISGDGMKCYHNLIHNLTHLNLSENSLSGQLPKGLANLTGPTLLNIRPNNFEGQIHFNPSSRTARVDVYGNRFTFEDLLSFKNYFNSAPSYNFQDSAQGGRAEIPLPGQGNHNKKTVNFMEQIKYYQMDIAVKYRIISEIINSNDEHVLNAVKSLLNIEDEVDFWEGLSAEDRAAIDEGLEQLDKGQHMSHESVREEIKNRFHF